MSTIVDDQQAAGTASIKFRKDIQGLRAIAVGLVFLAHASVTGFQGGFVGVDVFFVLSGYLITALLVRERRLSGSIDYWRFLARRLRRLLPALLLVLVSVVAAATALLSAYEVQMQTGSAPYAAAWLSNFYFAFGDADYFEALRADDLFLHTWSLGVEEQFYILWPWAIALFYALRVNDQTEPGRLVVHGMVALTATSLLLCVYLAYRNPILSFYMMPARGWQFGLGGLLFLYVSSNPKRLASFSSSAAASVLIAGLIMIVGSAVVFHTRMNYPGLYAVVPSLGALLVIASGDIRSDENGRLSALSAAPFVWLGNRSYSIYLWHWPVLILGKAYGVLDHVVGSLILLSLTLILSDLSYRFVELPIWKGGVSRDWRPLRVISTSIVAIALTICLYLFFVVDDSGPAANSPDYDPRYDAPVEIYRAEAPCDSGHLGVDIIPCGIGNPEGDRLAVLWGDSIGAQWATMIQKVFSAPDWQVIVLTKSACAIVDVEYYYEKARGPYEVCSEWKSSALEYIGAIQPDVVVVGSSNAYDFSDDDWTTGSRRILARLADVSKQVFVLAGTPELTFNGPSCLDDPRRFRLRLQGGERACQEELGSTLVVNVSKNLAAAVDGLDNVNLLDLGDLVCPESKCAAITNDGVVVFRDRIHLTATFAESVAPTVGDRMRAFGMCKRLASSTLPVNFEPCSD